VTRVRRAALALAGLGAWACRPPEGATPQIHVVPGAAAIWGTLFAPAAGADASARRPARVHAMREGEELGGPNAIGRPGDWVLENDQVVFVIDRLGSSEGFAESGGNLVDAADASARKDELGQMFTYFGVFPRQGVYDKLATGTMADGSAWIEVTGRELYEADLVVSTRYTLAASGRALLLETSVANGGGAPVVVPALGDVIQWGGAEKIAPGEPLGFKGRSSGRYVGGVGRFASYAMASTEGAIEATSGGSWTDTTVRKTVKLDPGATAKYARAFVVGARPDSASLVSALAKAADQRVGAVRVELESTTGDRSVDVPPDARLVARDATGTDALTIHADGHPPELRAELPAGRWELAYAAGGGRTGGPAVSVEVTPDAEARAQLAVTPGATAHVVCAAKDGSGMPCKVTFERRDGGSRPDFGPGYVAGPANDQVTTADGVVDVALAQGTYEVTASRGPEYTLAQAALTLAAGDRGELRLSPRRVVDTRGYLACDFHQHTLLSADAPVAARDRVIANAAEGVEVAVATEHNVVADFEPIVRALHLERDLVSIPGDELTSDASRHAWGHANAWPMAFDAGKDRGGAPPVRDVPPRAIIDELRRSEPADFVFQINHPRSAANGYFDLLAFRGDKGSGTDPDYDGRFDAIEVWNGRNVEARAKVLQDFLALLWTRHPVTPTADTDTHGIVGQEAGYPRTYVRVADDGHIEAWDAARTEDVVRGVKTLRDVVLTNGPMLRVTANGSPIGGVARGRVVRVKVHVESAPWVVVDRVQLLRASARGSGEGADVPIRETPLTSGAIGADVSFTVPAAADDAFVVVASGQAPMIPVLAPVGDAGGSSGTDTDADIAPIRPWAMTGPVWIDASGKGDALGRVAEVGK
jgi:hypothetical protein